MRPELKRKLRKLRENRAWLVLLRMDRDDIYCSSCGEPWETGREAVEDLSATDLLAFEFVGDELVRCPACYPPEEDEEAERLLEALKILRRLPAHDDPDELLAEIMG